jgi:uncharacterized protein YjiS (DUF1127 family)
MASIGTDTGTATRPRRVAPERTAAEPVGRRLRRAAGGIGAPIRRLAMSIVTWLERDAERRALQSLGHHMLKDMGVSHRELEQSHAPPSAADYCHCESCRTWSAVSAKTFRP